MAMTSARHKHVRVQFILRKSLKRRSRRAKHRKRSNKSTLVARSLITPSLLKQNVRFNRVSINQIPSLTEKKAIKNSETQYNNIEPSKYPQKLLESNTVQTAKQIHDAKLDNYNNQYLNVTKLSSHPNKNVIPSSLHQSDRKGINLSHDRTAALSPFLMEKGFPSIIKSKKVSTVYPIDENHHPPSSQKKKKRPFSVCILILAISLLILLIGGIILAIVLPLIMRKDQVTTTVPTTTIAPICTTSSHAACSTLMYSNLNIGYTTLSMWSFVSCCYIAPTVNQITIEIALQEDDFGYWMLDDMSATQGNGELISNGGFEYNMTNWTLTASLGATSNTIVDSLSLNQHTGSAFLYGNSANAPDYTRQTFPIIRGQNILISFWWDYFPSFGGGFGISLLNITLT